MSCVQPPSDPKRLATPAERLGELGVALLDRAQAPNSVVSSSCDQRAMYGSASPWRIAVSASVMSASAASSGSVIGA
jgi:hypothetical protein